MRPVPLAFHKQQTFAASRILVLSCCLLSSCIRAGQKETSYGNVHFFGTGKSGMAIDPCPPPDNLDIVLPDGRTIHLASVTKVQAVELFGEPLGEGNVDQGATIYQKFGLKHVCIFTFENGLLARVDLNGGVKVINRSNDRSLTLPASEAEARAVFGKPTEIRYPKSQQP